MLVSGWQQALTVLLAVIPGFVYQGVRRSYAGPSPEDRDLGVRLMRALAFSGLIGLIYLALLGTTLRDFVRQPIDDLSEGEIFSASLLAIVLVFVVPSAIALAHHGWSAKRNLPSTSWRDRFSMYDPTPTAWDFATRNLEPGSVRILTNDGKWIGGIAGGGSFFTSYPDPREIFLEEAWELNENGEFVQAINGSAGVWVRCDDVQLVQFLHAADSVNGDT
ncbi:DUF6338 family protein [Rhodococcus ruber]|uniref:DUF6338 family protein n=1 Tax=Rhodococcus ruber TaxID=1830 RepID=UPI00265FCA0F|nr:DUF6338 family protein [Rhodococcus ruber]MDO1482245.1 hypothetical protein [Rhodococcus ruber]